jgi:general secretion pathway protein C
MLRLLPERGLEAFAPYATLLLIVLLAYTLADLTWQLAPTPSPPSAADAARYTPQALPVAATKRDEAGSRLTGWDLFGAPQPQAAAPEQPIEAPDTTLNLTLRGLVHAEDQQRARAIIASGNNELQYPVGARLPGNAELAAIHPDRVILLHRGRYETLRLPRDGLGDAPPPPPAAARGGRGAPPTASPAEETPTSLQAIREQAMTNPAMLADLIQITPVSEDGSFVGFQLAPGRNRQMLGQFGLRQGDVVTSVNGIVLDNPMKGMEALNALQTADEVTLTVLRQGREHTMTLQVN